MATRRLVIAGLAGFGATAGLFRGDSLAFGQGRAVANYRGKPSEIQRWMDKWMDDKKALGGTLHVGRFKDPMYFLLSPISWNPNLNEPQNLQAVSVPTGFITDFASIPRVFWSALRSDGEYAYAAVVHDYLYWIQSRPRDEADEILKLAMQDLKVGWLTVKAIFNAVHWFGGQAWDENKKLKESGESRILKSFPDDPAILWEEWKQRPDVFVK
jgi:hypothetical protein